MGDFTLTIDLDKQIVARQSTDNLCIAKKVAGKFTTVFQDAAVKPKRADQKGLLATNDFGWKDQYQIFAAVEYKIGLLVRSAADPVQVKFGQASVFQNGAFQTPAPAPASDFPGNDTTSDNSFIAKSVPETLQTAVQVLAGGKWVSIYVDPDNHNAPMDKVLTPLNEYMLFWSSNVQTESMIDNSKSSVEFTFSFPAGKNAKKVRFGYATKDTPAGGESPKFYDA